MGVVNLAVLECVLKVTTKKTQKGRQLFGEKVHPKQNPGYAYGGEIKNWYSGYSVMSARTHTYRVGQKKVSH